MYSLCDSKSNCGRKIIHTHHEIRNPFKDLAVTVVQTADNACKVGQFIININVAISLQVEPE